MSLTVLQSDEVPAQTPLPRPAWLRVKAPAGDVFEKVRALREGLRLHTVCESAACPNLGECWGRGTATFMINGNLCTRACRFCDVKSGRPAPLDPDEPERVAAMVEALELRFVVITSVTRDDLPDGGAAGFAQTMRAIRRRVPDVGIEILIPDFNADEAPLRAVLDANPQVLAHNLETCERLTPKIRSGAQYRRSLEVLKNAHRLRPDVLIKSGIMVGLGEEDHEVEQAMIDLRQNDVEAITIGQYLSPSTWHRPVQRFVPPEQFERWGEHARALGFRLVASGPLVRSSYHAERAQEVLRHGAGG